VRWILPKNRGHYYGNHLICGFIIRIAVKYASTSNFFSKVTVLLGSPKDYAKQSQEFEFRLKWYSPLEILKQATSINAEIVALCSKLNPYTTGLLGVIKPGVYADLLVIDGNPLEDIKLLGDLQKNLKPIMKDGKIYKSTL